MVDLTKELTLDMIPDGLYREIAETIGIENLIRLSKLIGGTTFYLPKEETFLKPARNAKIIEEFNGYNHQELAGKYGVTGRWVRALCGDGKMQGQMELWGFLEGP
ncbi:Mor transcription activator family protein [Hungatella effluvii]|uniref:Mor transcription activator family protein n=1 Tax=Hungatella effluvii TaxID=1096246 RepID=UPI0022DEF774|nr:Mor transcription activator family protein [Hungatella effluvii]